LLTGTWAGPLRVQARTWHWLAKLFELELTASQAAVQTGVSYPTALKAFTTLRRAILASEAPESPFLQREVEADESYFGPRAKRSGGRRDNRVRSTPYKVPVFGIIERHGQARVEVVPDCSARTIRDHTLRWVKRGSLVYSDKWSAYDTLAPRGSSGSVG
jgi:transposase